MGTCTYQLNLNWPVFEPATLAGNSPLGLDAVHRLLMAPHLVLVVEA
jgi:hypothetical protein